jgi:hypothetical protein
VAVVIAVASVAVGVFIGIGAGNEIDRTRYLAANARILKDVPVFPGAYLLRSGIRARRADGARVVGYATTEVYVLPRGTTAAAVTAFYRRRLPRTWRQQVFLRANRYRGPGVQYRNGVQQLQLAVRKSKPQIAVTVDHNYYWIEGATALPRAADVRQQAAVRGGLDAVGAVGAALQREDEGRAAGELVDVVDAREVVVAIPGDL